MRKEQHIVVNAKVLPPVFEGVIRAKDLLAEGTAKNVSEAIKLAGISRSAFYKYHNYVYKLEDTALKTVTLYAKLSDKAGVFSVMTTILYENGANIITVHQGAPQDGTAPVTITVETAKMIISVDELTEKLQNANGIISVKAI